MKLSQLTPEGAAELATRMLGLDTAAIELTSTEGLATSLRRAASFMCPTSPGRLVEAVLGVVRPLAPGATQTREDISDLLELIVASGDLLELRHDSGRSTRLLYLGPPSFIERGPGTYLLMGIRPHGAPLLGGELAGAIEYEGHTRLLRLENGAAELTALGLHGIDPRNWVASPRVETPGELVDRLRGRVAVASNPGSVEGLAILDPTMPPRYYKGRWRSATTGDTGDFVARRPQAYGADLWCIVGLVGGAPKRMIEFPIEDPVIPGRDEAWRLQAAIDALLGQPQRFRVRPVEGGRTDLVVDFFSPLPGFAERYLQLVGLALGKTAGALFSFRVPVGAVGAMATLLNDMLWMDQEEAQR